MTLKYNILYFNTLKIAAHYFGWESFSVIKEVQYFLHAAMKV